MSVILFGNRGFVFGRPTYIEAMERDLKREGFTIKAGEHSWLRAKGKRRTWFVQERGGHWILSAVGPVNTRMFVKVRREIRSWCDGYRQTLGRHPTECVRDDVYSLAIKKGRE